MNSALNIVKIILLSIIAVALVLILIFLLNGKANIKGFTLYEKTELVYEETYNEEVNNLKVLTTSNDVIIEEKETDSINVKVYDRKDSKPTSRIEDNTLVIENKKEPSIGFTFGILGNSRIVITVPKNSTYNLDIEGTSSDIDSSINLKNVDIKVVSGDVSLKDSLDTTIKTTSGDVTVGSANKLSINTKSGDMSINSVNSKLDLSAISGDINISRLNIDSNSSISVTSGDILIGETNDIYIDTSVVSGDVKVNKNNRHAKYELKIKTTSGDIKVNN